METKKMLAKIALIFIVLTMLSPFMLADECVGQDCSADMNINVKANPTNITYSLPRVMISTTLGLLAISLLGFAFFIGASAFTNPEAGVETPKLVQAMIMATIAILLMIALMDYAASVINSW
ncbi:MAG: hypothetical protein ACP5D2_03450 [Candidatus Nanoarchaeia archaeon]